MAAKPALADPSVLTYPQFATTPRWGSSLCMLAVDFIALSVIYWLAVIGRHLISPGYTFSFYFELFPAIGLFLAAFLVQGLYPGVLLHPAEEMRRLFQSVTMVFLVIGAATFLWRNAEAYSRSVFLITWMAGAPAVLVARYIGRSLLKERAWWGVSAVVLGAGPTAQKIVKCLQDRRSGIRIRGVLTDDLQLGWDRSLAPILGGLAAAPQVAASGFAHYVIVAMPQETNSQLRQTIQEHCRGFRHILLIPDLPGLCSLGIVSREVAGEVAFELPQRLFHASAAFGKRTLDLALSVSVLLAGLPLFIVISLAIKLTSRGPVLFGHVREGRNGRLFKAFKFRTMVRNADDILMEHLQVRPEQFAAWQSDRKLKSDPRVTAVGSWLRRYSLDELPQLWNVLVGDMSLVGPRPIVKQEIPKYGNSYALYQRVKPGITGLWQVSGRNNTTYDERVAFDDYYVRNWSIWLDAYILARTVKAVFTADGAY